MVTLKAEIGPQDFKKLSLDTRLERVINVSVSSFHSGFIPSFSSKCLGNSHSLGPQAKNVADKNPSKQKRLPHPWKNESISYLLRAGVVIPHPAAEEGMQALRAQDPKAG